MSCPERAEENSFIISRMNVNYIVESWENLQKENFYFSLFIIATNTESEKKQKIYLNLTMLAWFLCLDSRVSKSH